MVAITATWELGGNSGGIGRCWCALGPVAPRHRKLRLARLEPMPVAAAVWWALGSAIPGHTRGAARVGSEPGGLELAEPTWN